MKWEPLLRITVVGSKLPEWTEVEFSDYWRDHHGPLVADWLIRHETVEYKQVSKIHCLIIAPTASSAPKLHFCSHK